MYYKDYAGYIHILFGKKSVASDESINTDPEIAEVVQGQLAELWSPLCLEHTVIDKFILEGRSVDDFAAYIRSNANNLADLYFERALRRLRQPKQIEKLRPLIRFKDK